ncbi:MAG: isoprenyl transferase [Alphaproteobacteria bacterium]
MTVLAQQDTKPEPDDGSAALRHVAIIMDGNGRWATARGLPRSEGHRRGVEAVRQTIQAAMDLKIRTLTLFGFSSENWSRPRDEIDLLFGLFRSYVRRDISRLHDAGVRVKVIGRREGLPSDIRRLIEEVETKTASNRALQVVFAFNYGGRDEIARAAAAIARKVADGELMPEDVDERVLADHMDTSAMADPDLIIRTSGEMRLSNFLLWQCAYAEFVFLPVFWPEFGKSDLEEAVDLYRRRTRRYGGIKARGTA